MGHSYNLVHKYALAYKKTLENMGAENIDVRIPYINDFASVTERNMKNFGKSMFWTGTARSWPSKNPSGYKGKIELVYWTGSYWNFVENYYYLQRGVRPIVILK